MKTFVLCLLLGFANGQGPLTSYSLIKEALLSGSELTLGLDSNLCSTTGLEGSIHFNFPLLKWQHVTLPSGNEEINSDDFYLDAQLETEVTWVTHNIKLTDDNNVLVNVLSGNPSSTEVSPITFNCELGVGAVAHRLLPGNDLSLMDTYNELKQDLLIGSHIRAIATLGNCQGSEVFQGTSYVVGKQIKRFEVFEDGTPGEYMVITDLAVLSNEGQGLALESDLLFVQKDGTTNLTVTVFNADLQTTYTFDLVCQLGDDIRFTASTSEKPDTYTTYQEIKESTLSGHDMQGIVFLEFCTTVAGEIYDWTGAIGSLRFDQYELIKAEVEYLEFSYWGIQVIGDTFVNEIRVFADETVLIDYFIYDTEAQQIAAGTLNCPLATSSLFHAIGRSRAPVNDFNNLVNDVYNRGQVFDVEIDFDLCETQGITYNRIFGGIAWLTFVSDDGSFFYAELSSLVVLNNQDPPAFAFEAASLIVLPNNVVDIAVHLYDWITGVTVDPVASDLHVLCQLGEGVIFHRYP